MKPSSLSKEVTEAVSNSTDSTAKQSSIDIPEMVKLKMKDPNLELEMASLGRGKSHYDVLEHRHYNIETLSTRVWHVTENTAVHLSSDIWGCQFYSEESYVIRWKYKISLVGQYKI
jgi:hypothetical protein